jgi:hypothetical protein
MIRLTIVVVIIADTSPPIGHSSLKRCTTPAFGHPSLEKKEGSWLRIIEKLSFFAGT